LKRSIVLLELIVSLLLFSIVAVGSSTMIFTLVKSNNKNSVIVQNNLLLETTRLFLSKQKDFSKIHFVGTNLYFDNNLLLENISTYEQIQSNTLRRIYICLYDDSICQTWKMQV